MTCPELVNQHIAASFGSPITVPGDLDLCLWSTTSPYGDYAQVEPVRVIEYASCSDWEADRARWNAAGKPPDSPPGLVGHTIPRFVTVVTPVGSDPQTPGAFIVRIGFQPASGTEQSEIYVTRPTWPGMSATQQQAIDLVVTLIRRHELGHQNLAGHTAKAYETSVSVPAASEQDAVQIVSTNPIWAPQMLHRMVESADQVAIVYDAVVANGVTQSVLGGTDPPAVPCNPPTLLDTEIVAGTATEVLCTAGEVNESQRYIIRRASSEHSTYSPPPSTFLHRDIVRTDFQFANRGNCGGLSTGIITTHEAGAVPLAGDLRTVSSSNNQSGAWTHPNTGRTRSESQTASTSASGLWDDADGILTLMATLTCSMEVSASWTVIGLNQGWEHAGCSGSVKFHFTVGVDSTFALSAEGEWTGSGFPPGQFPRVLLDKVSGPATVNVPLPASELASGVSVSLDAGSYELRITQSCPATRLNGVEPASNSTSVHFSASVTEGVL